MNDTEMNIRFYIPNLIKLGGDDVLDWKVCEATFLEVRNRHAPADSENKKIEANIYEYLLAIKKGNTQAYRFINFFDLLLESLNMIMDNQSKKKIKPILRNIFTAHDHKFLNFIGELIVLSKLLQSKIFLLNSVEISLSNNKCVDFELTNLNQGGKSNLLEVHNVHLNDDKVHADDEKLGRFFYKRRKDKEDETLINLTDRKDIMFIQVYWGSFESLRVYAIFFKRYYSYFKNIEPLTFSTSYDDKTPYSCLHSYGRITEVFANQI